MRLLRKVSDGPVYRRGRKGWRWTIAHNATQLLPPALLDNPEAFLLDNPPQRSLKESAVRTVSIVSGLQGEFFLKRYKIRDLTERWKHLVVSSKARQEWQMVQQALAHGIPTPALLAMAERRKGFFLHDALLITQAIAPSRPLIELIPEGGHRELLFQAADLLRQVHEAGIFHQDLHAGNILVGMEEKRLYLIDLHRSRFLWSISRRRRLWNLAQFFYSLQAWLSPEEKEAFLQQYEREGDVFKGNIEQGLRKIERKEQRLYRRHMQSRTKRCLKESGGFSLVKEHGWQIWCKRGWKTQGLLKIVARHRAIVAQGKEGLIKADRRTAISLFNYKDTRLCVKEYRYQGAWQRWKEIFRGSKARRAWLMGNGLVVRGVRGIIPLALLERRKKGLLREAFLAMETPPGYVELDRYMVKAFKGYGHDDTRREAFVDALAGFMADLYLQRIFHRDLKTCNIMVREEAQGWDFCLVDMDDVRLDKKIPPRGIVKGLIQLHTSTPLFMEMGHRIGFLTRYLQLIGRDDVRDTILKVVKGSTGRRLVYVAPDGDVIKDVDWEGICGPDARLTLPKEDA
jgi:tRNA A-37 threonylcarbamoyl transferase component Bud32